MRASVHLYNTEEELDSFRVAARRSSSQQTRDRRRDQGALVGN